MSAYKRRPASGPSALIFIAFALTDIATVIILGLIVRFLAGEPVPFEVYVAILITGSLVAATVAIGLRVIERGLDALR